VSFSFPSQITVQLGSKKLSVYTALAQDQKIENDTLEYFINGLPIVQIPYFNSFDIASDWLEEGGQWEWGSPTTSNFDSAYSAPNAWVTKLNFDYSSNSDAKLYTPVFDVSNVSVAKIKFWHKFNIDYGDNATVEYSLDGGLTWINLGYVGDFNATNWYQSISSGYHSFSENQLIWKQSTYNVSDLLQFAPNTIQFRFHFVSNNSRNREGWIIDDFSISSFLYQRDVAVTDIINPTNYTVVGTNQKVKVVVRNNGLDTLSNIPISYQIDNSNPITENISIMSPGLLPNDSIIYEFSTDFTVGSVNYNLCVETQLLGDAHQANDKLCKPVVVGFNKFDALGFKLLQNIPNPANDYTIIVYEIPHHGEVSFKLFNSIGIIRISI
jgi:hypothetical protein